MHQDFGPGPEDPNGLNEASLIQRCQRGERDAFDELVTRYESKVYNLALRIMGDPDEAFDVSQEAFLRIFRGIESFQGGSALTTWVYRIVHNLCLDEMKRRRRRPQIVTDPSDPDEGGEPLLDRLSEPGHEPEAQLLGDERTQAVRAAVYRMKGHHRDVLVLYDLEGFSYNEIAEMLKTNVGTVKSRLNRARLALAKELEKDRHLFFG